MEPVSCPFCGSKKLKVDHKKQSTFKYIEGKRYSFFSVTVRCNKCHARGPTVSVSVPTSSLQYSVDDTLKDKAIESWNTRADN